PRSALREWSFIGAARAVLPRAARVPRFAAFFVARGPALRRAFGAAVLFFRRVFFLAILRSLWESCQLTALRGRVRSVARPPGVSSSLASLACILRFPCPLCLCGGSLLEVDVAKYRIAWMPGDGIGVDVMDGAKIVLDAMKFDAEYIPADIGWEFWCKEGNALPDRTIKILQNSTCALFGAITSKPQDEAKEELAPEL